MKAFPTPTFTVNNEARITSIGGEGGMDLRDYFAAKAMQALIASPNCPYEFDVTGKAQDSYLIADEMLKAREA